MGRFSERSMNRHGADSPWKGVDSMTSRKRILAAFAGGSLIALSTLSIGGGPGPSFGDPLPKLTPAQRASFVAGKSSFLNVETVATGLGPVFNDVSCVACHSSPAPGGGSTTIETRFGRVVNGQFDPMTEFGGSLIQRQGIGLYNGVNFVGEVVPPQATVSAGRRTTPLFGLGLVNAVPDSTFQQLASLEQQYTKSTAGRANILIDQATGEDIVGRFGWKCQQGSLFTFSGDAYLNEMGITTPLFPSENCPQGNCALLEANPAASNPNEPDNDDLQAFTSFMSLLAPPPQVALSSSAKSGARTFVAIGCANCHFPALQTGRNSIAALNNVTFFPYSDFLLHDMGSLGDGIAQAGAGQTEMRTAPLWGVREITSFLHDGRATSLSQAILAHAGQGLAARNQFAVLSKNDEADLIAFLNSL
jgi:CxxC motif-containing protein (DUF1111 family)